MDIAIDPRVCGPYQFVIGRSMLVNLARASQRRGEGAMEGRLARLGGVRYSAR
jgi:hypothetical protein